MKLITAVLVLAIAAAPTVRADCSARTCEVEGDNGVDCECAIPDGECFNGGSGNPGCWHRNDGEDVSCECIPKEAICDGEPGGLEQISSIDTVVDVCLPFGAKVLFTSLPPTDEPTEKPTPAPTRLRPPTPNTKPPTPNTKRPTPPPTPSPTTSPTFNRACNTDCETKLGGVWVFQADYTKTCDDACGARSKTCSPEGTNSIFVKGDNDQASRNLACVVEEYYPDGAPTGKTCGGYTEARYATNPGTAVAYSPSYVTRYIGTDDMCLVPGDATARCDTRPFLTTVSLACCCVP